MASEIKVDTISEKTSANGVTIDGVNIKDSALATAGSVPLSTIDIDGGTDIGAAIVDADLFIIDDGAGGTNRKVAASRIKTYAGGSDPASADGDTLGTASLEWSDLYLADGGQILFGNDQEITLTHSADSGLLLKHTATADDKPINLVLQTGETDMAANDVIGKISWQAPDEGTGTDAILVSAAIQAVAEGDHSSSSNATRLEFMTGASEAATAKMKLSSAGDLTVTAGNIVMGTAGKGIDFSAQTATSESGATTTSELLDHYEEGTWTGVISDGTNNATMVRTIGNYTRIGGVVIYNGHFTTNSLGSVSGGIRLTGLPFTNMDDFADRAGVAISYSTNTALGTAGFSLGGHVLNDTTYIYLSLWDATSGTSALQGSEWSSDGEMIISGSYKIT